MMRVDLTVCWYVAGVSYIRADMRRLLRSAIIVSPGAPHHMKSKDILVEDGIITHIADTITEPLDAEVYNLSGHFISAGFCDMFADFADPGFETKEDRHTGSRTALAGGFTAVTLSPQTFPMRDNKAQIEYALQLKGPHIPELLPLGCITVLGEGKEPAELLDMYAAGAVAFSDGLKSVANTGIYSRALQYALLTNALVYSFPLDSTLARGGLAAEGEMAVNLGLKGIPAMAEELMVQRDIELAAYTGGRLHFVCITTAGSVDLIRKAKQKGINITCATSPFHLLFDDSVISTFDSRYKIKPVLRTAADVSALISGIADGTIDAICSLHTPQNDEIKDVEFEYAAHGSISLQTTFSAVLTALKDKVSIETIINTLCYTPRRLLNKTAGVIEGDSANLTWFNVDDTFMLSESNNLSKSKNSPLLNVLLQGCIKGVLLKNNIYINE